MNGLSVIIPVKPPEPYLPDLIGEIHSVLDTINHEIFVQTEVGLTKAIIKGVEKSNYNTIVVMDADGSHNPTHLPEMFVLCKNYSLVIGSKVLGEDKSTVGRRMISKLFRKCSALILGLDVKDPMSGFVMGDKELFSSLKPTNDWKFVLQLLTHNPRPNVVEYPIHFLERKSGKSKATFVTGIKTLITIVKLRCGLL